MAFDIVDMSQDKVLSITDLLKIQGYFHEGS